MPAQVTERFLRTHWQRANLEHDVFTALRSVQGTERPDVGAIVKLVAGRHGIAFSSAQTAAVLRSIKALSKSRPTSSKKLLDVVAGEIQEHRWQSEHDDLPIDFALFKAHRLLDQATVRRSIFGTTVLVPERTWDVYLPANDSGLHIGNIILVKAGEDAKVTEEHETLHRWNELTGRGDNKLTNETSAHYLEGRTPKRIASTLLSRKYPRAHPLSRLDFDAGRLKWAIRNPRTMEAAKSRPIVEPSFRTSLYFAGLPENTPLEKVPEVLRKARQELSGHLEKVRKLERKYHLPKTLVAMVLKNVPAHLAPQVIEYGVRQQEARKPAQ